MLRKLISCLLLLLVLGLALTAIAAKPGARPKLPAPEPGANETPPAWLHAAAAGLVRVKTPEAYGARGDGRSDDTAALQATFEAYGGQSGSVLLQGVYLISRDLLLPRNICLIGSPGATITSTAGQVIKIKGFNDPWDQPNHLIEGLTFDNVGLLYGETPADNGANVTISRCVFKNVADKCIHYRHNCWNTLISNTLFHSNHTTIYFDFGTAYRKSGSNLRIVNSVISHAVYGVYMDGDPIDGCHLQIVNSDFEFLDYGVRTVNVRRTPGAVLDILNSHFELNRRAHIHNDGAYINVQGGWYFPSPDPGYIAHFVASSPAAGPSRGRLMLSSARIAWVPKKFCKITDGAGIYLDHGTIWDPFPNQFQLCTDDSTQGPEFDGGQTYTQLLNQNLNAAQTVTFDRIFPWDTAPRQYTLDFTINGTPDADLPPLIKFVHLNKDVIEFPLAYRETGIGTATLVKTKEACKVHLIFHGSVSGTRFYAATVSNTQSPAINGGMDFIILRLGRQGTAKVTGYSCAFK